MVIPASGFNAPPEPAHILLPIRYVDDLLAYSAEDRVDLERQIPIRETRSHPEVDIGGSKDQRSFPCIR